MILQIGNFSWEIYLKRDMYRYWRQRYKQGEKLPRKSEVSKREKKPS